MLSKYPWLIVVYLERVLSTVILLVGKHGESESKLYWIKENDSYCYVEAHRARLGPIFVTQK